MLKQDTREVQPSARGTESLTSAALIRMTLIYIAAICKDKECQSGNDVCR